MNHLLHRLNEKRQEEQGFTLIELLVVIVIIGILSAVVVFAVGGITNKGETESVEIDRRTLQTAEEVYFASQSPAGTYAAENVLVEEGFLNQESCLHDITNVSSTGYDIVELDPDTC